MRKSSISIEILVKGRPITEYSKDDRTFIEGRANSEFEIQIKNLTGLRREVILSVDGLSIVDGQPASDTSTGYLLSAYQSLTIPGWSLGNSAVAKFVFGSRKSSYAEQSGAGAQNCGVIGAMVWSEKVKPVIKHPYNSIHGWNNGPFYGDIAKGSGLEGYTDSLSRRISSDNGGIMGGMSYSSINQIQAASLSDSVAKGATATAQSASLNNLGTEFGGSKDFKTTQVSFDRDVMVETLALFYDDAKGLKARGIEIAPAVKKFSDEPNPFPAMGCKPPAGWKG